MLHPEIRYKSNLRQLERRNHNVRIFKRMLSAPLLAFKSIVRTTKAADGWYPESLEPVTWPCPLVSRPVGRICEAAAIDGEASASYTFCQSSPEAL